MNGGYVMIKASDSNAYTKLLNAINLGKPILFYENDTTCYYIDSITTSGTNVVLTKGGKTITIANDNTITSVGDIQITTIEITNDICDDFNTLADFDNFIITKELYDKLLSGKYILKVTLYDAVDFIGFPNWVSDNSDNLLSNALVDTHYIMPYLDSGDNGAMCYLVIGQLKDERYFLVCNTSAFTIINA